MQNSTLRSILRIGLTTVLAGLINYIYHPAMLQFMSIETFGEFTAILGIFNILGVLTTGIGLFLVQKMAQSQSDPEQLYQLFRWSWPRSALLGIGVFLLFLLLTPVIKWYLGLDAYLPLILVGTSILISFFSLSFSSLLQGLQQFTFLGAYSVFGALSKFLLGLGLAYLGFEIYAAIGGLIGGGILGLLVFAWWTMIKIFPAKKSFFASAHFAEFNQALSKELKNLISMFVLVLLLSFFMNGDVILARNLFDPSAAGIYGSIAVIGKFVIFVGAAIETVYYPKIIQHQRLDQVPSPRLKNPLWLLFLAMMAALLGTWICGPFVLAKMKPELVDQHALLLLVVMMCSLYGFISFYAKVLVSFKDRWTNPILALAGVALIALVYLMPKLSLPLYVILIALAELLVLFALLARLYFLRNKYAK